MRPWHSAQVPPSLAHSAALGEFARLEGASPPPRPHPPTVADPPSRPGVGIADCAQNPTLALMSAATRQRNYLESRVQCARCERGSGWLVACVSKLTSAAPPRELARVFSLASGALRRRARPRPLVLCVRAPPTPGSRGKKTGGRAAACVFFGPKIMFDGVCRRHSHPENCPKWHTPTRSPDAPTARFRSRHAGYEPMVPFL